MDRRSGRQPSLPKEPEVPAGDREWTQDVFEGGTPPNGRFSLVLLTVDPLGQQMIERWLNRARQGLGLPGMAAIPGAERLDVVERLTLE